MHKGVKGGICSKYAVKHKKVKPLDIFFKKHVPPRDFGKKCELPPTGFVSVYIYGF
jgi:hypothetical protein